MLSKDAVIIDVRNHYEAEIGRFVKQQKLGGAQYIDPMMRKSTDFKEWLAREDTKKRLEGKQVIFESPERTRSCTKRQLSTPCSTWRFGDTIVRATLPSKTTCDDCPAVKQPVL